MCESPSDNRQLNKRWLVCPVCWSTCIWWPLLQHYCVNRCYNLLSISWISSHVLANSWFENVTIDWSQCELADYLVACCLPGQRYYPSGVAKYKTIDFLCDCHTLRGCNLRATVYLLGWIIKGYFNIIQIFKALASLWYCYMEINHQTMPIAFIVNCSQTGAIYPNGVCVCVCVCVWTYIRLMYISDSVLPYSLGDCLACLVL